MTTRAPTGGSESARRAGPQRTARREEPARGRRPARTAAGRPPAPALVAAAALALGLAALPGEAGAEVAGRYKVSGTNVKVKVKSWGEDCGPRPTSSSRVGGKAVEVERAGAHLIVGAQRTDRCWSQNPRVQRRRASAAAGRWQVECETPTDDPRFEHGEYTLEVLDADTLRFTEESRYDWRLESDHCEAIVLLTRTYVRDRGEADSAPGKAPAPTERARCATAGEPVRLELRPARAEVAPRGRVCLRAQGWDSAGCRAAVSPTYGRSAAGPAGRLGDDGCFVAGDELGRVEVTATAGPLSAAAHVEVANRGIGDLVAAGLAEAGDDLAPFEDGPTPVARPGAVQGLGGAQGSEPAPELPLWVVLAGGGGLVVLLGLVAFVATRKGRRRRGRLGEDEGRASSMVVASAAPPPGTAEGRTCPTCHRDFDGETFYCPHDATELVTGSEGEARAGRRENKICPKCRRGYPSTERVCPADREELVPYSVWRATQLRERAVVEIATGMICPQCASRYEQDVQYCQRDGARLVPIN